MKKGTHKTITVRLVTWNELIRIKYARGFQTIDEVIVDLLADEDLPKFDITSG
jgi:hypothetical protein